MNELIYNELLKELDKHVQTENAYAPSYQQAQKIAFQFFKEHGLPQKSDERYLNFDLQKDLKFKISKNFDHQKETPWEKALDKEQVIVFRNGQFSRELSRLPDGLKALSPAIKTDFRHSFDALNFISAPDAQCFKLAAHTKIEKPLTIIYAIDDLSFQKIICPRLHFILESHAELQLVERFEYLVSANIKEQFEFNFNRTIHAQCANGARLVHLNILDGLKNAVVLNHLEVELKRDSFFQSLTIDLGIKQSRQDCYIELNGENAQAHAMGMYSLSAREKSDFFTLLKHNAPHTESHQHYKGILRDETQAVYNGQIDIAKDCSQVQSTQLNNNLILSKKSRLYTRPQLLVSTDDVKCSHGATIGDLSEDEIFYLNARGISKEKAIKMLSQGFLFELVLKLNQPLLETYIQKVMEENL